MTQANIIEIPRTSTSPHHRLLLILAIVPLALAVACGGSDAQPDAATMATQALIEEVTTSATDISALLTNADVSSPAWRSQASAALDQLSSQIAETAAQLETTDGATAQHQQLAAATVTYSQAASALSAGIQTQDLNKLDEAAALLADATASLVVARSTLNN